MGFSVELARRWPKKLFVQKNPIEALGNVCYHSEGKHFGKREEKTMKAEDIRQRLAELALDTNEYRINAGGAMVLHGLREETHDLDIWCTKKLGDTLAQRCEPQMLPNGARRFVPAPDVEIFEKPDVESYENMLPGETVFLNGIPGRAARGRARAQAAAQPRKGPAGYCRSGSCHRRAPRGGNACAHRAGGDRGMHGAL